MPGQRRDWLRMEGWRKEWVERGRSSTLLVCLDRTAAKSLPAAALTDSGSAMLWRAWTGRHTSRALFVPLSPSTDLSSHLQSVLYFKGGFFKKKTKHRDICIEMFYSELLLMECSEAEPGEGAGKLLQRHSGEKGHGSGLCQTLLWPPSWWEFSRGAADVNTAL